MRHGHSSLVVLVALCASAQAHVVLDQPQAEAGSSYRAALRVGHGCGNSPVVELIAQIPPGVRGAKPMAKPGWQITLTRDAADNVTQIRWSGGRLDPAQFDEFVLMARLPDQPGPLYWKVSQICESGRADWIEVPAAGQTLRDLKAPAALLEVRPAGAAAAAPQNHQH